MPNNVHGIFLVGAGLALPDQGLHPKEGAASSAPTPDVLQRQEETLVEVADNGGSVGGLRVVGDHEDPHLPEQILEVLIWGRTG